MKVFLLLFAFMEKPRKTLGYKNEVGYQVNVHEI